MLIRPESGNGVQANLLRRDIYILIQEAINEREERRQELEEQRTAGHVPAVINENEEILPPAPAPVTLPDVESAKQTLESVPEVASTLLPPLWDIFDLCTYLGVDRMFLEEDLSRIRGIDRVLAHQHKRIGQSTHVSFLRSDDHQARSTCYFPYWNLHHLHEIDVQDESGAITRQHPPIQLQFHQLALLAEVFGRRYSDDPEVQLQYGVILADEVGLGKTWSMAAAIALHRFHCDQLTRDPNFLPPVMRSVKPQVLPIE